MGKSPAELSLGPAVQTKPICRLRQRWTRAGEGDCGAVTRPTAPNKPNLPRTSRKRHCPAGPQAPPTLETIVRNKANLPRGPGWARTGMVAQAGPAGTKACETNPIPAGAIGRIGTLRQTSYDKSDTQPASAKQSQFARADRTRPRLPGPPARPLLGTSVQNKANSRSSGGRDGSGTDNCERSTAIRHRRLVTREAAAFSFSLLPFAARRVIIASADDAFGG